MRRRFLFYVCCLVLLIAVPFAAIAEELPSWTPPSIDQIETMLAGLPFDEFADEVSRIVFLCDPMAITKFGLTESLGVRNDRLLGLPDTGSGPSLASTVLDALSSFNRTDLSFNQRVTFDALVEMFSEELESTGNDTQFWSVLSPTGWNALDRLERFLGTIHPSHTMDDLDDYIVLLWQVDDVIEEWILEIDQSADAGVYLPQEELQYLAFSLSTHSYYAVGQKKLSEVPNVTTVYEEDFLDRLSAAISQCVIPAYARLVDTINRIAEDAPRALNWAQHPAWQRYYVGELREDLGIDIPPEAILAMANAEIDRITAQIASLRTHGDREPLPVGGMLRELWGPRLRCTYSYTAGAMLEDAERIYSRAIVSAGSLFHQIPGSGLQIMLAEVDNPQYALPSLDGTRPSRFLIPTDTMFEKNDLPTLVYHEAIPGHHLQFEIAKSASIPLLFRFNVWGGFTEGWATYAEQLADEQGWHSTNMCALVSHLDSQLMFAYLTAIETGLCGLRWDMDQAVAFIQPYIPATRAQLEPFFTGFFYEPTQVTRYFVGRMVLLQERERAMLLLGDCFNLADFHQAVLAHGNIPLDLLSTLIDEYVKQESRVLLVQ
jgi:uncharacterized protein (DUF885 family)